MYRWWWRRCFLRHNDAGGLDLAFFLTGGLIPVSKRLLAAISALQTPLQQVGQSAAFGTWNKHLDPTDGIKKEDAELRPLLSSPATKQHLADAPLRGRGTGGCLRRMSLSTLLAVFEKKQT